MERFVPRKRIAVDGVSWWCVWDNLRRRWSSFVCHRRYKTKKEAIFYIDKHNKELSEYWGVKTYIEMEA